MEQATPIWRCEGCSGGPYNCSLYPGYQLRKVAQPGWRNGEIAGTVKANITRTAETLEQGKLLLGHMREGAHVAGRNPPKHTEQIGIHNNTSLEVKMRENLKAARKKLGLTQQQMAEKLNISHIYYVKIECGDRTGIVELWDKMEDLTGVPQRVLREIQDTRLGQADNQ